MHRVPLCAALSITLVGSASAQLPEGDTHAWGEHRPPTMHTLLERTIFQIDILTLDIWLTPDVQSRMTALATNQELSSSLADSLVQLALDARNVVARLRFKRGVSYDQFVNAIAHNARRARDAGIIATATYDDIEQSLPKWYAFLQNRNIHEGDEMYYRIHDDTLRTIYRSQEGETLLDHMDVGSERRLAVMGGYLAPNSDFRKGLLESLFPE